VISTNCPDGPQYIVVDKKTGALSPTGDPVQFSKNILEFLAGQWKFDEDVREQVLERHAANQVCRQFDGYLDSLW